MPRSPAYGVRASAAALGVLRQRNGGNPLLAALRADATYAFCGEEGLSDDGTWRDLITNLVATSAARPTIGTLGGRRAAMLNGSQSLQATFPSEIAQPYSLICVSHLTGSTSLSRVVHDGIVATKRATLFHQASTGKAVIYAGTGSVVISADTLGGNPTVTRIRYAGASSLYSKNGADTAISLGTAGLTGLTIGAEYVGNTSYFIGPIALIAICAGANSAARAARIAAVAQAWYGI